MKVCILAPVHRWDDTRVYQKEACTLAAAGYDVTLIAQAPRDLNHRGVKILPAPRARSRMLRFLKLPVVLAMAIRSQAHVYHVHNPDMLPIALLLKLLRKRVIYDTHEDFAQRLLIREWIWPWLKFPAAHLVAAIESIVGRVADASIATQEIVKTRLGTRAELIENPPITRGPLISQAHFRAAQITRGSELRLIYAGGLDVARGINVMIDALSMLKAQGIDARLWLIGWGDEVEIRSALLRPAGECVDYLGRLPQMEAFAFMLKSDIGLVPILDVADHAHSSPNKLYEYLALGLPVVASDFPRWRRSVNTNAALIYVPAGDAAAIATAIGAIAAMPNRGKTQIRSAQEFVRAHYSWEAESNKLLRLYDRVVESLTR